MDLDMAGIHLFGRAPIRLHPRSPCCRTRHRVADEHPGRIELTHGLHLRRPSLCSLQEFYVLDLQGPVARFGLLMGSTTPPHRAIVPPRIQRCQLVAESPG